MDRQFPPRHPAMGHATPTATYPPPYPQATGQPPIQIPYSDPFPHARDPFLPASHGRKESIARGWPPQAQGNVVSTHPSPSQSHALPPPPPPQPSSNVLGHMSLPYDPSRRRSLGGAGSPPQYAPGPRNMPPPSPPQMHQSSASALYASAPRGPPTASPFSGIRDVANLSSSHRPGAGMSISSILGEEAKPANAPPPSAAYSSSMLRPMNPPSPGRARSSSMREGYSRNLQDNSPPRASMMGEPRSASAVLGYEGAGEQRRDRMFGSPQLQRESAHSFRAFQAPLLEARPGTNGSDAPGRPNSQPVEAMPSRPSEEGVRRDEVPGARLSMFRAFGESPHTPRRDATSRQDAGSFLNGNGPTSQPIEQSMFRPHMAHEQVPARFQPAAFGHQMREDHSGLFRPAFAHPTSDHARESIESRQLHDARRDLPRSSPPVSDLDRYRNGYHERPLTFEEHQRMEAANREYQPRKESDGSTHRSLLGISPELNRRGRNSPLPQAVQGAQPRHIGPGGDNPNIKSEFGRMFSGLGSGFGSATPSAVNGGTSTPSRILSPPNRHTEGGDFAQRTATEVDEERGVSKTGTGGKKSRRSRADPDIVDAETYDGRMTPSLSQRGNKRAKTAHPLHHHHHRPHHHHHHHVVGESAEPQPGSFTTLRFPSNPPSHSSVVTNPAHHHHHHHTAHAHPGHHHHHPPRPVPAPKKPTLTIHSKKLLDEVASKPRKHLGTQLYTTTVSAPPAKIPSDSRTPYASTSKPIPRFEGKENCTFTVRVPRWYLTCSDSEVEARAPSKLEEICKRRQLFGSDVYTDDSDVVAAAVHSGWIKGDFGEWNEGLRELCDNDSEQGNNSNPEVEESPLLIESRPTRPVVPPSGYDLHITLLILPPLDAYASTNQHHVLSREWNATEAPHDGMSFIIQKLEFVDEGVAGRSMERGAHARKERLRREEEKRREAVEGLLLLPGMGVTKGANGGFVKVGA